MALRNVLVSVIVGVLRMAKPFTRTISTGGAMPLAQHTVAHSSASLFRINSNASWLSFKADSFCWCWVGQVHAERQA